MTPSARVQAAIEVLDLVIAGARDNGPPADRILADWFRQRRFAGSGDRRAVRELVYRAIRACGDVPVSGRAAMLLVANDDPALAELFDGSRHGPAPIAPDETEAESGIAPRWLEAALAQSGIVGEEARALLDRAPLDVRVNTLRASRDTIQLPEPGTATAAPQALRFPPGTPVQQWVAFGDGLVEVQDSGSQLAGEAVGARPGETIIDLCAGAGGKTLALAAQMENRGTLIAADTDKARLSRLPARAQRASATIAETVLLDPGRELERLADWRGQADAALVDAPCSGTGTWRRNPEARWRLTQEQLGRYAALQTRLLDLGAALVRPGGRLVYVTCSLLDAEGADQVARFLAKREGAWRAERPAIAAGADRGAGVRLSPLRDECDGFFIARLARVC